jgi:hypothetical protein
LHVLYGQQMKNIVNSNTNFIHCLHDDFIMTPSFATNVLCTCPTQLQVILVANVPYNKKFVVNCS